MLDEDIVEYFKRRAAQPNVAPYQTQINQALREMIGKAETNAAPAWEMEKMVELIVSKVAEHFSPSMKKVA